jgi:hypothetical protein
LPLTAAGSSTPQCAVSGFPSDTGQTTQDAFSHTVITKSIFGDIGLEKYVQNLDFANEVSIPFCNKTPIAKGLGASVGFKPAA